MGYPPSNGWVELCEGEEVDGGRGERGVAGPTLMLYTRNFFLYSFCAQSPCIAALLFFLQIFVYASRVCALAQIIECSLMFLRVTAKTCGGVEMKIRRPSKNCNLTSFIFSPLLSLFLNKGKGP